MIRPLRRLHRLVFLTLAVVLPLALALALLGRTDDASASLPASIGVSR